MALEIYNFPKYTDIATRPPTSMSSVDAFYTSISSVAASYSAGDPAAYDEPTDEPTPVPKKELERPSFDGRRNIVRRWKEK